MLNLGEVLTRHLPHLEKEGSEVHLRTPFELAVGHADVPCATLKEAVASVLEGEAAQCIHPMRGSQE